LFDPKHGLKDGICLYIIGNKGYPLLPLLMIPKKQTTNVQHSILESFYNKHSSMGRVVIDNGLIRILKKKIQKVVLEKQSSISFSSLM
jgi:hypothetical protein